MYQQGPGQLRTLNEINTSPSLSPSFLQNQYRSADFSYLENINLNMEGEQQNTGKRGRKRQVEDDNLPEDERIKKQKNREAAKKCREKKEREANDLKKRNKELEDENKGLADDKKKLEAKVKNIMEVIQNHINKGCILPKPLEELWQKQKAHTVADISISNEGNAAADVLLTECTRTPPESPSENSSSSGQVSPSTPRLARRQSSSQSSVAPSPPPTQKAVSLFSGAPLPSMDFNLKRSASKSPSPSTKSSSMSPSPSQTVPQQWMQESQVNEVVYIQQLLPEQARMDSSGILYFPGEEGVQQVPQYMDTTPATGVPTVVEECELESYEDGHRDAGQIFYTEAYSADTAVMSEDAVSQEMAASASNDNLPSTGFDLGLPPDNYSYTEDLQQVEPAQQIIQLSTAQYSPAAVEIPSSDVGNSAQPRPDLCATALLDMGSEISPSLREQIQTSYSITNGLSAGLSQAGNLGAQVKQMPPQQQKLQQQQPLNQQAQPQGVRSPTPQSSRYSGQPFNSQSGQGQATNIQYLITNSKMNSLTPVTFSPNQTQSQHQQFPQGMRQAVNIRSVTTVANQQSIQNSMQAQTRAPQVVTQGMNQGRNNIGVTGGQYMTGNQNTQTNMVVNVSRNGTTSSVQRVENFVGNLQHQTHVATSSTQQVLKNNNSRPNTRNISVLGSPVPITSNGHQQNQMLGVSQRASASPHINIPQQQQSYIRARQASATPPSPGSSSQMVTDSQHLNYEHSPTVVNAMVALSSGRVRSPTVPVSTQELTMTSGDNTLLSAQVNLNSLPSLGFIDLSAEENIFDKKPSKKNS